MTSTSTSSLAWPKIIYAFCWLKKEYRVDHNQPNQKQPKKRDQSCYDMSGKLVLDEINVKYEVELKGCEYCHCAKIPLSSYSGKLVCHKCAIFLQRVDY
jgi:hypothetical protein